MYVHLLRSTSPEAIEVLHSKLDQNIILSTGEVQEGHRETTLLIAGRPDREEVSFFPVLQTLIVPWIGIPPETLALVREFPNLALHNLHHNAGSTAEMAVALLLAAAKRIIPFDQALRANDWRLRYQRPAEVILLAGKKALILGYGEVGRRIGTSLESMGVHVVFISRSGEAEGEATVYPVSSLAELLPDADFLILALPFTPETEGLIGEKELRMLPASSVLVNVARGKIIEESALYQALHDRWIFGAGLDVWFNYPGTEEERSSTPPGEYPWHTLDNVVLSPHRAGHVRETEILRMRALAELLNEAARGLPISNQVDLDLGY